MSELINAFIVYAREDKETKRRLLDHINPLKKAFNLVIWHDEFIEPGQEWKPQIEEQLNQADLFLFLISVDFMISDFITQVEFKNALDRHKKKQAIVIPIIIKHCQWDIDFDFENYKFNLKELQVLPDAAKPIDEWQSPDQAYNNIAGGIRKVLQSIKETREKHTFLKNEEKKIEAEKERQKKENEYQTILRSATDSYNFRDYVKAEALLREAGLIFPERPEILDRLRQCEEKKLEEDVLWRQTLYENKEETYKKYLVKYPFGKFVNQAKDRIEESGEVIKREKKIKASGSEQWLKFQLLVKKKAIPLVIITGILLVMLALFIYRNLFKADDYDADNNQKVEKTEPGLKEENITYTGDGITMNGFVVYDSNNTNKRPAILIVHEWWGLNDYSKKRARQLADLGYIAMALDMYGNGKTTDNPDSAGKYSGYFYQHIDAAKSRFDAALSKLKSYSQTDGSKVAAIGYCFGGFIVLGAAKLGDSLAGVVSFHGGGLNAVQPVKDLLKAKLLVCQGGDDSFVPQPEVDKFKKQMDSIGANYTLKVYPGAKHAFTNPDATALGEKFNIPIAYNPAADTASWKDMKEFFGTIFK